MYSFSIVTRVRGTRRLPISTSQNPALPVKYLPADLREPLELQMAVDTVRKFHSRLDILVNNAGIELDKSFEKVTIADWDLVMNVNLRGAFLLTQAVLPLFDESGGAIVNISSVHASHAFPNAIPYACSKAGMIALTRNLALELSTKRIRVNCICPGYIDTRLWRNISPLRRPQVGGRSDNRTAPRWPPGSACRHRRGSVVLASDSSTFITGTDLLSRADSLSEHIRRTVSPASSFMRHSRDRNPLPGCLTQLFSLTL